MSVNGQGCDIPLSQQATLLSVAVDKVDHSSQMRPALQSCPSGHGNHDDSRPSQGSGVPRPDSPTIGSSELPESRGPSRSGSNVQRTSTGSGSQEVARRSIQPGRPDSPTISGTALNPVRRTPSIPSDQERHSPSSVYDDDDDMEDVPDLIRDIRSPRASGSWRASMISTGSNNSLVLEDNDAGGAACSMAREVCDGLRQAPALAWFHTTEFQQRDLLTAICEAAHFIMEESNSALGICRDHFANTPSAIGDRQQARDLVIVELEARIAVWTKIFNLIHSSRHTEHVRDVPLIFMVIVFKDALETVARIRSEQNYNAPRAR